MSAAVQGRVLEPVLTVFCPTVCCVAVGVIAHGSHVFALQSGFFQLGVNALIVGVLVLIARRWPVRRFLAAGVTITVAMTVAAFPAGLRVALHTAVLMLMWVGVVVLNVRVLGQRRWICAVGQYVVWSLVFALGLFGTGGLLMVFFQPAETMPYLAFYARLAVLTGIGLGIGFKIQAWFCAGQHPEAR